MLPTRITANLAVDDIATAKSFYTDFLGLTVEAFTLGWVAAYRAVETGALLQLMTRDATAPQVPAVSVHTEDVDSAYEEAQRLGYEIVHPLTNETWGVRRFFVRAPDGNVLNIVQHTE